MSWSFVVRRTGPKNAAVGGCLDEVESYDVLFGKDYNDYVGGTLNLGSSQIGERELLGCDSHVNRDLLSDKVGSNKGLRHMESQGVFVSRKGPSWVEAVTSNRCVDPYLEDCQLEVSIHPGSALDNSKSVGLRPVDVTYLNEDINGSSCERLEDLVEMEQINDDVLWKQTSIKHLKLKQWLLNNQNKVSRSSFKTNGERGLVSDMVRSSFDIHDRNLTRLKR
ncbi:hypothetical protein V6N13_064936 [Hibiscus sabdariffa]|uniref:Uncharacterized protein n=1 Tax=Hibiscus sabdariffa TaxID=183260 RepID=A0ABR2EBP6_9ROSI